MKENCCNFESNFKILENLIGGQQHKNLHLKINTAKTIYHQAINIIVDKSQKVQLNTQTNDTE